MSGKYFFGIILILIGAGFLFDQFAIISFGEIFSLYWPSILIVVGILNFFDRKSSKFGNVVIIIFASLLQLDKLNIIHVNVYKLFWPVILILIGLKIIFSRNKPEIKFTTNVNLSKTNKNMTLEDRIDSFIMMSGIATNNQSQEFKGGKATAIMGGIELDLRGAKLHNNEASIEINAIMGGVELYVPDTWRVEITGTPLLGGWSNKRKYEPDMGGPVLKIKCFVLMGGVEIK